MHIIQLTSSRLSGYGGLQSVIKCLSEAFVSSGNTVSELMLPSLDRNHLPRRGDRGSRLPLARLEEALLEVFTRSTDVVLLSHNLHLFHAFGVADAVLKCAREGGVPHLGLVHDVGPKEQESSRIISNLACVTTSAYNAGLLHSEFGTRPIEVIPPPLDFERFRCTEPAVPLQIAYPGRLSPSKGAHNAVMLVGTLSEEIGPLSLVLSAKGRQCYGESDAYTAMLIDLASNFPQLSLSFFNEEASSIKNLYSTSQLTLSMPTQVEGFNMIALESLACERPVIAAPTGGMSWLQGKPGCITVSGRNAIALAKGIVVVLRDWDMWNASAAQSRVELMRVHDPTLVAARYLEHYSRCLTSGSMH